MLLIIFNISDVDAASLNCDNYLSKGKINSEVSVLQKKLNKIMKCDLDVDGNFGALTKQCVEQFQNKYNLAIDGIVGPQTCSKLNSLTSNGLGNSYAIVKELTANVREDATTSSNIIKTVDLGTKIKILNQVGDWYQIKLSSNEYGYIRSDLLTRNLILVDISKQVLYFYDNNKTILEANVVTGMKKSHDTPIGSYILRVSNLQQNRTLRGYNDDGSQYAADVKYWMPFNLEKGIGFHDASWRSNSQFISSTYKTNGSHGCINMQLNDAKILYENINKDTIVVIRQ